MLTVEDMNMAIRLNRSHVSYTVDNKDFYSEQIKLSLQFLEKIGFDTSIINFTTSTEDLMFQMVLFFLDKEKHKKMLAMANNRAFW